MISRTLKPAVTRLITPVASFALRIGVTANAVTWIGAVGVVISALFFYPRGEFFLGTAIIVIIALVSGLLVPYIRAKAEMYQIECTGGIAERTERLMISLSAIALDGLGLPYVLAGGVWLLAILGCVTVVQRMIIVKRALA